MAKKKTPILGGIGDKLNEIMKHYTRLQNENMIYDEAGKKLDLTRLMPPKELSKLLENITSGTSYGPSLFEKFFDIGMGRQGRYSEYEQILFRIPEASQAIQIYVDSVLAPNAGDRENQMQFDVLKNSRFAETGRIIIETILSKTNFYDFIPQIVYTTLLYGDSFIELDPTKNGIRYILHTPKNVSIIYDQRTDIELGVLIQIDTKGSQLMDMLSDAYPSLRINANQKTVSIISNKVLMSNNNDFETATAMSQVEELIKDLVKDYNVKYKYLPPHRYVRFPLYYNNIYYPYGTSIFDSVRSIAKQLLLIESALSIYRATRTPLRTLWTIEVGSTPEDQISGLTNGIMNRIRRQRVIDPDNGGGTSIDSIPEMMSLEEDIWTPSINGQPLLKGEPIQTGDITPYINDAEYFRKKLLSALGIPPAYLAEEQGASTRALLTLEDIRFSRTIKKFQTDFNSSLMDFINTCFLLTNNAQYVNSVFISLPEPKTMEDNIRLDNIAKRLGIVDSILQTFPNIPKLWLFKNIVGFSEDEIEEMKNAKNDQEDLFLFTEQKIGEMNSDGGIGGMGGGSDMGMGDLNAPDDMNPQQEFDADIEQLREDEEFDDTLDGPMGEIDLDNLGSAGEEEVEENIDDL